MNRFFSILLAVLLLDAHTALYSMAESSGTTRIDFSATNEGTEYQEKVTYLADREVPLPNQPRRPISHKKQRQLKKQHNKQNALLGGHGADTIRLAHSLFEGSEAPTEDVFLQITPRESDESPEASLSSASSSSLIDADLAASYGDQAPLKVIADQNSFDLQDFARSIDKEDAQFPGYPPIDLAAPTYGSPASVLKAEKNLKGFKTSAQADNSYQPSDDKPTAPFGPFAPSDKSTTSTSSKTSDLKSPKNIKSSSWFSESSVVKTIVAAGIGVAGYIAYKLFLEDDSEEIETEITGDETVSSPEKEIVTQQVAVQEVAAQEIA
jgi:hypothetical protein